MFGFVTIYRPELKIREYDMYRSYYCGLCAALKKRYGRIGQLLLNYDMTFAAILLGSLYEEEPSLERKRCLPHPVVPHEERVVPATQYAADMTILLSYNKALDDWHDDRQIPAAALSGMLGEAYRKLRRRYPRQAIAIEENVQALAKLEKNRSADVDEVAGCTGRFMGEILNWKCDFWQQDLKEMGFYLGKFIYLADALADREKDAAKGSYNLMRRMREEAPPGRRENFDRDYLEMMTDTMGHCSRAFERLPLLCNAEILRNILYAGVWQKCLASRQKEEGPGQSPEGQAGKVNE